MPNRSSKPKRPSDINELAKSIVDIATGATPATKPDDSGKNSAAVALGRQGAGREPHEEEAVGDR